jgi:hypothetical protein
MRVVASAGSGEGQSALQAFVSGRHADDLQLDGMSGVETIQKSSH